MPAPEHSIHLARLRLDPRSREVQRDLADCQALHRTVMAAFPDAAGPEARARFGVLHRPELDRRGEDVVLLVQSNAPGDWARLPAPAAGRGYLRDGTRAESKEIGPALGGVAIGQHLAFRLRGNPTRTVNASHAGHDRLAGKRVDLLREDEQVAWLTKRLAQSGCRVAEARVAGRDPFSGRQTGRRGERQVIVAAVLFEGVLLVDEPSALVAAVAVGVGPAKAYGCGLLSLAPARE